MCSLNLDHPVSLKIARILTEVFTCATTLKNLGVTLLLTFIDIDFSNNVRVHM